MLNLRKKEIIYLILILILTFVLVCLPHFSNPFPIHADEWHHITETIKLKQNSFRLEKGSTPIELGFHLFLLIISLFFNLVLVYKFFPAIWAIISSLVLFSIVKKKTSNLEKSFFVAIFAMIFFASIKSNVNISGLWFFTPLTFSIPFIFLYIYLFEEGLEKENKKMITASLCIMIFLLFIHAISVLFALPFIIIYSLIKLNKTKKQYKTLLIFILIPIIGILFYKIIMNVSLSNLIPKLFEQIQFRRGWGVLELNNSPFELYSLAGYILAIIGAYFIIKSKENLKKYLIYILWPAVTLVYIIIFKLTGVSYLSPYQRNLYYLAISLPLLSSLGLYNVLEFIKQKIKNKKIFKIIIIILIMVIIFLTFLYYLKVPEESKLYKVIDNKDYNSIKYLSSFPKSKVMASQFISEAIFPVSGQKPVATIYFYGNKADVEIFFNSSTSCNDKSRILKKDNASYVLTQNPINCSWNLIYKENNYIYWVK